VARILAVISRAFGPAEHREPPVHFHAAGGGAQEVCYDLRCRRPHLDV
jgi:hypothetical protein